MQNDEAKTQSQSQPSDNPKIGKWEIRENNSTTSQATPAETQQKVEQQAQKQIDEYAKTRPEDIHPGIAEQPYYEHRSDVVPIVETLIPLTLFIMGGFVLVKYFTMRHNERMAIIDRGLDPLQYKHLYSKLKFTISPLSSLKWGLLAVFVGLGLAIAGMLAPFIHDERLEEVILPACMLLSGGAGLIVYYFVAAKKLKEEELKEKKEEMMEV